MCRICIVLKSATELKSYKRCVYEILKMPVLVRVVERVRERESERERNRKIPQGRRQMQEDG